MAKAIFAIDFQNDFLDIPVGDLPQKSDGTPMYTPALPVAGASEDVKRFRDWIIPNLDKVDRLFFTQDSHHYLDIAQPDWWQDENGNTVNAFTPISYQDILDGKFVPRRHYRKSLNYVKSLEDGGEFGHFIWPPHCLMGTWGHNFHDAINEVIVAANKIGIWPNIITKGSNPFTEHFGAFRANVPDANDPSTALDHTLLATLQTMDEVIIVGEARSHCVANSLRQLMQTVPALAPKLVIMQDCMSDVPGLPAAFYASVDQIYADARAMGVRFETTQSYRF